MLKSVFNKKRLVIAIVVIVAVLVFAVTNVALRNFLLEKNIVQIDFQSGAEYDAVAYGNDILIINNEEVLALDRGGNEKWEIVQASTTPAVAVRGKRIMITDLNGRDINVYKEDKLLSQIKTETEILSAKMNKNGYVAVATEEQGYKGMITVYDKNGTETFRWHSGHGYIGGMDISSSDKIAVAQIMTDREKVYSRIISIDMKKDGKVTTHTECEGIVMEIAFRDNGSFVAVSDEAVYGFDKKGKEQYAVSYGGRIMQSYNIANENNMVFAFDNGRNGTVLESYSNKGKCRGLFDAEVEVRSFDVNGECIVLGTAEKLLRINPAGKVRKETALSRDVKTVKIFTARNKVIVIGGNSAELYKI